MYLISIENRPVNADSILATERGTYNLGFREIQLPISRLFEANVTSKIAIYVIFIQIMRLLRQHLSQTATKLEVEFP